MTANTVSAQSSDYLEELKQKQGELQQQQSEINSNIEISEQEMKELEGQKAQLESDVSSLQESIDDLMNQIVKQQNKIKDIEEKIENLHNEINQLQEKIDRRSEKLENQARSVQTAGNPSNIVDIVLSAESVSDLIGRIGFVSQIVSSNQNIVQDQIDDQNSLEEVQASVEQERDAHQQTKADLEVSRNNLVTQQLALEDKIVEVAAAHDLSAQEFDQFVSEQQEVAQASSDLSSEMEAEQQRLIEEARKRQEEERRRFEEERKRQEEEAARLAEGQAAEEEAGQTEAQEKAENSEEETQTQSQAKQEAKDNDQKETKTAPTEEESKTKESTSGHSTIKAEASSAPITGSGWTKPAAGGVTSHFGNRFHPIYKTNRLHAGTDFGGGGTITASRGGTITVASYSSGLGYYVRIDHGDGFSSVYGHMQPGLQVAPGQSVSQGQTLGIMGTTGSSTGVHLHFEIHKNGVPVNPMNYL